VAAEPAEQLTIAGGGGGELLAALQRATQIEGDGVMSGGVGVDAADDAPGGTGHG
jgi:hypothetical protein